MTMSYANWAVLIDNFLFALYIALAGVFWASVLHLSNSKWRYEIRFLMTSATALFPLGLVLLLIILASGAKSFPWMGGETMGEPLNGWHNILFFNLRQIILYLLGVGLLCLFSQVAEKRLSHCSGN